MANITLYNRIEPHSMKAAQGFPQDRVSAMSFDGDLAVFWATVPAVEGARDESREARVVFGGMMYRFQDNSENRLAMAEFMKGRRANADAI